MRKYILTAFFAAAACGTPEAAPTDAGRDIGATDAGADLGTDMLQPACEVQFLADGDEPFDTLSEYCLFSDTVAQTPTDGVIPFDPVAVLYADESLKARFIAVPPGQSITFDAADRWDYPDGTVLVKTFYYYEDARDASGPTKLLETRLIVKRSGSWEPYIYAWNDEQTEATFLRLGDWKEFDRINEDGETVATRYRIPNKNQCGSCHDQNDALVPLGPRAFQLNANYDYGGEIGSKNQLEYWAELGILDGVPADLSGQFTLTDYLDETADLDGRARSYLEVNCAHCHADGGAADPSGLRLAVTVTEPGEFGVCRRPVAAGSGSGGFFYDIVPGDPDSSIMVFRMASTDAEIKMPELPTQTSDDFGVQLISSWISGMTPIGCPDI